MMAFEPELFRFANWSQIMKSATLIIPALLFLFGCAAQEPVAVVDKSQREWTCDNQLDALRQQSKAELDACHAARLAAESGNKDADAAARQLEQGRKALHDKDAELATCRADLESQRQAAKTEAEACEQMRQDLQKRTGAAEAAGKQLQRMKELEDSLRQRLKNDIGAKDVEIERLRSQLSVRVLDRILFESGSADILPKGREVLDLVAGVLAGGDETIRIEGHADSVPIGPMLKSKYFSNWELSTGRASSVVRYFETAHGIEPTRMEAVGFSKYRPIAPNDSEESRQRNRRVEIVLTPWKPVIEECGAQ